MFKNKSRKYLNLKTRAIELRKKGLSYNEIKKQIPVSKSTLSLWLKNIPLKTEYKKRFYTKNILILARGPQSQKQRRLKEIAKIIENAEKEIKTPVSFESYKLIGAFLYWAEGSKTSGFKITNSDPNFILFIVNWIERILHIAPQNLKAWLNIYSQQNDVEIKKFWSKLTHIPIKNFGKSFIKPSNKGFKKNNLYYGTISIMIPKGTDIRYRVFGWIKAVLKKNKNDDILTQKEWKSLKETIRPVNLP
jgi:hypothetical protein